MNCFVISVVFYLYLQTLAANQTLVLDNTLILAERLQKFQTWAQKRTLTQERMTINNTFTDQMTESIKDVYKEIESTDLIRKVLMYDNDSNVHRVFGQKFQVSFERSLGHMSSVQKQFLESKEMTEYERSLFRQSIAKWDPNGYIRESIREFGKAERKIVDIPEPRSYNYITNLVENVMKTGSVTAKATALMGHLGIHIDIYRHLENSPSYRRNKLAIILMGIGIGLEEFTTDLEYFIDKKGLSGLCDEEKDQLIKLYRDVFHNHWNNIHDIYKCSLGAI